MILSELILLSSLLAAPGHVARPALVPTTRIATQDRSPSRQPGRGAPGRGTPEPFTILLVAGSILGYGALRMRGRKAANQPQV